MRVLFLHQNFPGQFLHIALALQREGGHELVAVVPESNTRPRIIPTRTYPFAGAARSPVPLADHYTQRVARGAAVADALLALRREGFVPDVVVGHGGWGETLFAHDVWPSARVIVHAEFYYSAEGGDAGFDPEFSGPPNDMLAMQIRARNAAMALAVMDADQAVAPTHWQASRFPSPLREKITVAHEGIDTDLVRPNPRAEVKLRRGGVTLRPGDEVITFVNRNLEPHRGFHIFMRALPEILAQRPTARAVIVGGDETSYGPRPADGRTWRQVMLDEVGSLLPMERIHFVGRVSYDSLIQLLQVSTAHVYLTYPFVLSWSMLDAMSAGALVIASLTPPVKEVIQDKQNGLLHDFFDCKKLADTVSDVLSNRDHFTPIRQSARATVMERYDLKRVGLPGWQRLISLPRKYEAISQAPRWTSPRIQHSLKHEFM